ncbi:hypothetical protein ACET3X_001936 [Alternaria dauci]|uniref:Uncharacterized protein n=1 Tax=Alternaria dauci TaxID=48095 RepID=A0ABR3UZ25_9PLEO
MTPLDPPTWHFTPEDQRGHIGSLESPKLDATAPKFVPVKSSKLNATAPSFLLSRLSIFHSPAGNLAERPRKANLVLPNASDDIITDSLEMMQCPKDGQVGRYTSETTLEFNNGWHHNDPVLAAIYHILKTKKKNNFSVLATNHGIRPVDDAPPLWPPHMNLFDIKCYYLKAKMLRCFWKNRICDEENAEWITILPNGSPPTAETIHIFESHEGKWLLFGDWLEKVSPPLPNWIGRTGYSLQFEWWKYSGSKRRFEDLPGEIRTSIYRCALGGEVYPMSTRDSRYSREVATPRLTGRLTLGMGYNRWIFRDALSVRVLAQMSVPHVPEARSFVYEPALELLLVSSWMRDEVLHTGWELLYNCFFGPRYLPHGH